MAMNSTLPASLLQAAGLPRITDFQATRRYLNSIRTNLPVAEREFLTASLPLNDESLDHFRNFEGDEIGFLGIPFGRQAFRQSGLMSLFAGETAPVSRPRGTHARLSAASSRGDGNSYPASLNDEVDSLLLSRPGTVKNMEIERRITEIARTHFDEVSGALNKWASYPDTAVIHNILGVLAAETGETANKAADQLYYLTRNGGPDCDGVADKAARKALQKAAKTNPYARQHFDEL